MTSIDQQRFRNQATGSCGNTRHEAEEAGARRQHKVFYATPPDKRAALLKDKSRVDPMAPPEFGDSTH